MRIDQNVIAAIADDIRTALGDNFDEEAFLGTLDGETDFMDMIGLLIRERTEAKAFEEASREMVQEYTARARRLADKQASIAKVLGVMLDAAGMQKVQHPLGTVSRTKPRKVLVIEDEAAIPSQLTKRVPDKAAIKAQIMAGEDVPGASLSEGEPGVSVRVK